MTATLTNGSRPLMADSKPRPLSFKVTPHEHGGFKADVRLAATGNPSSRIFADEAEAERFVDQALAEWEALPPGERRPQRDKPRRVTNAAAVVEPKPEPKPDGMGNIPEPRKPWHDKKTGKWQAMWRDPKTGKQVARTVADEAEAIAMSRRMFDEWVANGQPRPTRPPAKAKAKTKTPKAAKTPTTPEPQLAPTQTQTTVGASLPTLGETLHVVGLFLDEHGEPTIAVRGTTQTWVMAVREFVAGS